MQFDDLDNKIREAADNHYPGYDEKAWDKMNHLLDKHLPEEKKRRRGFLLLVFLFASLALIGYTWQQLSNSNSAKGTMAGIPVEKEGDQKVVIKESLTQNNTTGIAETGNHTNETTGEPGTKKFSKQEKGSAAIEDNNAVLDPEAPVTRNNTSLTVKQTGKYGKPVPAPVNPAKNSNNNIPAEVVKKDMLPGYINPARKNKTVTSHELVKDDKENPTEDVSPVKTGKNDLTETNNPAGLTEKEAGTGVVAVTDSSSLADNKPATPGNTDSSSLTKPATGVPPGKKQEKNSRLFFAISGGVDVSAVKLNTGKPEFIYGLGAGYKISDRLAVRSGFYAARKIYTANGSEYKGSAVNYYPNLKSVDGDCMVYEIPLLIDYNFGQRKNHSWFVSTGLSSLLMKKETYNYYYKPNYSSTYVYRKWSISNQNKHYFSVLDLSGGYTYQLNKTFSLRAEPYVRIPLTGIGNGQLKLNSGGVLFTAIISPFNKK